MRPSASFATAYGFYFHSVGETVSSTLAEVEALSGDNPEDRVFRIVYWKLVKADSRHWLAYWQRRVQQRGMDADVVKQCLWSIPAEVTQSERWQCLRMHLNAIPTDRRLRFVDGVDGHQPCYLCNAGEDSQEHIFGQCAVVRNLKEALSQHSHGLLGLSYQQHVLTSAGDSTAQILRFNDVVPSLRRLAKTCTFQSIQDLVQHGVVLFRCPGLR